MKRILAFSLLLGLFACAQKTETVTWAPLQDHILSRWAADVDPLNPLPEYPMLGKGNLIDVCDDTKVSGWYYVRIAGK